MSQRSVSDDQQSYKDVLKVIAGLSFILAAVFYSYFIEVEYVNGSLILMATVFFGCYMALNIGANDAANNVGPAVGSKAIKLGWAIALAAVFELSGVIIAGADVVTTIKKGIVDSSMIDDPQVFIWIMMASLLGSALWLNVATYFGAPVSTTHAIVGGVAGAGIAGVGWSVVKWKGLAIIASSWVISPLLGGLIAASLLFFIKKSILQKSDKKKAAQRVVPFLIAFMSFAFAAYLSLKGLSNIIKIDIKTALLIGFVVAVIIFFITKPMVVKTSQRLPNSRRAVNWLFNIPLVFSVALLSFAHGANDVSNAVGPLAAIVEVLKGGANIADAGIPFWIMVLGALGIATGLVLFGPKLIRTVGSEITELDQVRAFCIAMAAALTVIIASQLGLPVSSTHTAIGGIFGVGFLREWLMRNTLKYEITKDPTQVQIEIEQKKLEDYKMELESIGKFKKVDPIFIKELIAKINEEKRLISQVISEDLGVTKIEKKALKAVKKHEYVKRSALKMIVAAWIITVPAVGILSALIYFMLRGMML